MENITLDDDISMVPSLEGRYPQVYRQQGIRFPVQMFDPKLYPIEQLDDIELTMLHYYVPRQENQYAYGISQEHPFIKGRRLKTASYHVRDLTMVPRSSRKKTFMYKLAEKIYHKHNPKVFWLRDETKLNSYLKKKPWQIIVDYCLMGRQYEIRPNPMRHLYEFDAYYRGYLNGIKKQLNNSTVRHHFYLFHVPDKIPTIVQMRMAAKEMKRAYYERFPGYKELALLDFWKWLDPNTRKQSIFNEYIDERKYEYVDLLFYYKGHVVLMNLQILNKWITGQVAFDEDPKDVEILEGMEDDTQGIDEGTARRFQKRFYRFLMMIMKKEAEYEAKGAKIDQLDLAQTQQLDQLYDKSDDTSLPDEEIDTIDKEDGISEAVDNVINAVDPEPKENPPTSTLKPSDLPKPPEKKQIEAPVSGFVAQNTSKPLNAYQMPDPEPEVVEPIAHDHFVMTSVKEELTSSIIDKLAKVSIGNDAVQLGGTQKQKEFWERQSETYKKLKSPFSNNQTLEEFVNEKVSKDIKEEDVSLPPIDIVTDKSMLQSTLKTFDKKYIRESLHRDIAKSILSVQKTGINVTNYEVERQRDVTGDTEIHTIQFTPVGGSAGSVKLKLPTISEEGIMKQGLSSYRLRKQRRDKVIRKVDDNKVSLTSFYGKLFLNRCTRRKFDYDGRVQSRIDTQIIEGRYTDVAYGKVNTNERNLPPIISAMMQHISRFTINLPTKEKIEIDFTQISVKDNYVILTPKLKYDINRRVFIHHNQSVETSLILGFSEDDLPVTFAEIKILGEMMPVGFILGRALGFSKLISMLGLKPEKYERGTRFEKHLYHLELRFADEKWVFDKRTMTQRDILLIAGFLNYEKYLKDYSVYDFDTKEAYGAILMQDGVQIRYERELDLMQEMFIDPIAYEMLVAMKEPTEFNELLIRAVELLTTTHKVQEVNMDDMVISGYDRIAGAVYSHLISNLRVFKSKAITHKRRFDMKPDDVLLSIMQDPACELVDEINPIHSTKEKANVTFLGMGGRSRQSMSARVRSYDDTDMGTISEATVDSGDVAITTYLSANPQFTSYLGVSKRLDDPNNQAAISSASLMLAPFSDYDNPPRKSFSSIQASHRIPVRGAMPAPVRTGYEYCLAHISGDNHAFAAEQDGRIKEKGPKYITLLYKDGSERMVEVGLRIASSKGAYYKHNLICDLDVGQSFKKGEIVVYNTAFYARDIFAPGQVILKDKMYGNLMFVDDNDTWEDSSAICQSLSYGMSTTSVKERLMVVNASDNLLEILPVGSEVDIESTLFYVEDKVFESASDKLGSHGTELLRKLSRVSPKAGVKGRVIKREILFFCEEEELSPSIKSILADIHRETFSGTKIKQSERRALSGQIHEPMKIKSNYIGPGQVGIKYYIETQVGTDSGDKVAYFNQLKSVIGRTFTDDHRTVSGRKIHVMFSYASVSNRIVGSPEVIGTLNLLLRHVTEKALEAYDS